ncbi:hypothetical protein CTAYLR_000204 [Chrysophaeum taylorii]|uniref:B30.2/SPRY domain-containing protein n=1 Tax=Chrysophaeum taylorii TaxID=2483200 RepID=A0AAD7XM94_9STRA|nr:hypothetical protein CTAYLR_000204 [Chrysophaeum taylorii]
MENYIGSDCHGWGYLANKAIWHNKGKIRSYGELFKEGDTIGVHLDMDAGNLWFSRNGRDLGAAVEGLDGNLYPAFSLYNKGDQLTLLPPEARVGYGNVTATSPMHAACSSFKMKPGDQIESLRGLATVLGMADHQLWYALDAREKTTRSSSTHVASRWSRRQVFEMRAKPLEYKFLPAPCLEEKGCRESSIDVDDVDLSVATMIAWFEEWTADMDAELVRCMESLAARRGPFALRYDEIDATALQPYPSLVALSLPQVTLRMALLTHLNELLPPILPLLDLSAADSWISATSSSIGGGRESYLPKLDARSLCHAVRANNFRIFPELKHHILARLLAKQTKCDGDNSPSELIPRLTLVVKPTESRSDRKRWIDEEYRLARSQFGQACAQLAAMPLVCRQVVARPAQDERILRGEGDEQECGFHIHVAARKGRAAVQDSVIDRYRDFFDSVCSEVCDDRLFTPTSASPARRYMVNASFSVPATPFAHPVGIDSTRLATYRAFGHLVGVALRTQVPLPKLNFARALWTSLTGLEPTRAELARIDDEVIKVVECLENLDAHGVTSANFDALLGSLDVRFAIPRSHDRAWGNNVIELCDKGRQRRLAFDNVREFAASLLSARAREAAPALAAVRAGIEAVFPRRLLALYTPEDLERAVRGTIDPSKNATVILDTES